MAKSISLVEDGLEEEPGTVELHTVEGGVSNAAALQEPAHHARLACTWSPNQT